MTQRIAIAIFEAGDLTGDSRLTVLAETKDGARFLFPKTFADTAAAERFMEGARNVGSIDPARWAETFPRYGSPAYLAEESEAWGFAEGIRAGLVTEADAPDHIRTLL